MNVQNNGCNVFARIYKQVWIIKFGNRYPKNIKGLVLIDPGSEFLEEEWRKIQTQEEMILEDSILAAQIQLIPQGFRMEVEAYPKHDSLLKTFSIKTDIPITLLESTKVEADDPAEQRMIELQSQLYNRFQLQAPQTKIISTSKSGHFIQIDEPKLVISAIMEMLKN